MKATFDIPDELYRRVKARSALEGRALRSVAVQLFQEWLDVPAAKDDVPASVVEEASPWLAVTQRYVKPEMNHDLADMRSAAAKGWAADVTEKLHKPGK